MTPNQLKGILALPYVIIFAITLVFSKGGHISDVFPQFIAAMIIYSLIAIVVLAIFDPTGEMPDATPGERLIRIFRTKW